MGQHLYVLSLTVSFSFGLDVSLRVAVNPSPALTRYPRALVAGVYSVPFLGYFFILTASLPLKCLNHDQVSLSQETLPLADNRVPFV